MKHEKHNLYIRIMNTFINYNETVHNILRDKKLTKEEKTLAIYEELTKVNEHTLAIMAICKHFGEEKDVKKLEHIHALQDLYGYLTPQLRELRDVIWGGIKERFYVQLQGMPQNIYDIQFGVVNEEIPF